MLAMRSGVTAALPAIKPSYPISIRASLNAASLIHSPAFENLLVGIALSTITSTITVISCEISCSAHSIMGKSSKRGYHDALVHSVLRLSVHILHLMQLAVIAPSKICRGVNGTELLV